MKKNTLYLSLILAAILLMAFLIPLYNASKEDTSIRVKDKERVMFIDKNQGTRYSYVVYADGEVFELGDNLFALHWNTLDIFNQIEKGRECRIKAAGWRIPFFSMKRNILEVYECK